MRKSLIATLRSKKQPKETIIKLPEQEQKKSKMGNKIVEYEGEIFHSKKELAYYIELLNLQKACKITNLRKQVEYLLQDGFRDKTGKKHIAIKYFADFVYNVVEDGEEWVVDVKASKFFVTDIYRLKKKLLLFKYPNINFKEVY